MGKSKINKHQQLNVTIPYELMKRFEIACLMLDFKRKDVIKELVEKFVNVHLNGKSIEDIIGSDHEGD